MEALLYLLLDVSLEISQQDSWLCNFVVDGNFSAKLLACKVDEFWAEFSSVATIRQRLPTMLPAACHERAEYHLSVMRTLFCGLREH